MTEPPNPVVEMVEKATKPKIELVDARPPEFSDEALALRLVERDGDGLCYVAAWSRWYAWTGARWEVDTNLDVFDRARGICRAVASDPDAKGKTKTDLTSARTVAAVERLARSDRRVAAVACWW